MGKKRSLLKGVKSAKKAKPQRLDIKVWFIVFGAVIMIFILLFLYSKITFKNTGYAAVQSSPENNQSACNDNKDNDGNGKIDFADPSCASFCTSPNAITGFYSGYGQGAALGQLNNAAIDSINAGVNNISMGCCLPGQCFYFNTAGNIGRCYSPGDSFTNNAGKIVCTANGNLARWCKDESALDSNGNCLILTRNGEYADYGSYTGINDKSTCGDDQGEYLTTTNGNTMCCHFPNSKIVNNVCVQDDGRNTGKYIEMNITLDLDNNNNLIYNCTNPINISFDSTQYHFTDDQYQPDTGYKFQVLDSNGNPLDEQKFLFEQMYESAEPGPDCFSLQNGEYILDLDKCPRDIKEVLDMPCYLSAAKVRVLNESGSIVCQKNVGGLCSDAKK